MSEFRKIHDMCWSKRPDSLNVCMDVLKQLSTDEQEDKCKQKKIRDQVKNIFHTFKESEEIYS